MGTFILRSEVSCVDLTLQTLAVSKWKVFPDAPVSFLLLGEKISPLLAPTWLLFWLLEIFDQGAQTFVSGKKLENKLWKAVQICIHCSSFLTLQEDRIREELKSVGPAELLQGRTPESAFSPWPSFPSASCLSFSPQVEQPWELREHFNISPSPYPVGLAFQDTLIFSVTHEIVCFQVSVFCLCWLRPHLCLPPWELWPSSSAPSAVSTAITTFTGINRYKGRVPSI